MLLFLERVGDIEDMKPCKNQKENCIKYCPRSTNADMKNYYFNFGESKWMKVHSIKDLLDVLVTAKTTNYQLVGGNTARGEVHITFLQTFLII